jgi:uncharacterized protein
MPQGRKKIAWAALAALFIFGSVYGGAGFAPPAFGEILFKRSSLTIETKNGPVLLKVEVADTDPKREQGLMFRRAIADNEGMIFLFDSEHEISMWMKNTYISLDMIFIGDDWLIVNIAYNAEPFSTDVISSMRPASRVIEVGAGQAKRLGLTVGDRVSLKK